MSEPGRLAVALVAGAAIYALRPVASLLPVPAVALRSGPGFAWTYATVGWVAWVWRDDRCREATLWVGAAACLGVFSELFQLWGSLAGTFDPVDLVANLAGAVLGIRIARAGGSCGNVEA